MKRKEFVKLSVLSGAATMLGKSMVHASNLLDSPFLQQLAQSFNSCNRVLVIIQLTGGNDGLNCIIPIDQYGSLATARPTIVPPLSQILTLNNNITTGMHPSMPELRNLYNENKVNIVQGVSYSNPNFSHFRATDIMQSGSDSTQVLTTGWMGRYLQLDNPGVPDGYPNSNMPDPLAIQEASQTASMIVRTFYWIGIMITGAIIIGFITGGSFFYWKRYRRRKLGVDDIFSDAGGTVRLNLDDYLLSPGDSVKNIMEEKKRIEG